jgi:hypothetical protein
MSLYGCSLQTARKDTAAYASLSHLHLSKSNATRDNDNLAGKTRLRSDACPGKPRRQPRQQQRLDEPNISRPVFRVNNKIENFSILFVSTPGKLGLAKYQRSQKRYSLLRRLCEQAFRLARLSSDVVQRSPSI